MSDRAIRQLAVSIALVFYALVTFLQSKLPDWTLLFVPGLAPEAQGLALQALAAAWSGLKLGLLIVILERLLYRIFARRFLGQWAYESSAGNFAIVSLRAQGFWAGGTHLFYSGSLYRSVNEVIDALRKRGTSAPMRSVEGSLVGFKDDSVTLVYQVSMGKEPYDARKGILTLSLTPDSQVAYGVWESTKVNQASATIDDREVRVGDLKLYRPGRFLKSFSAGIAASKQQTT